MITSFYFVLWILLYFLILISGNPFLNEYAFFIVFAAVILLGRLGNSLCRETIDKRNRRDTIALLEIFYTGNQSKLCSIMQKKLWLQAASFIYMFIATVALILGKADWIIVAIFAFFTFITGRYVHRLNAQYKALCATDRLILPDGPLREAYEQYAARRSQVDFAILMPKPSSSEKALRIFNIIVSVVCILIGLISSICSVRQ